MSETTDSSNSPRSDSQTTLKLHLDLPPKPDVENPDYEPPLADAHTASSGNPGSTNSPMLPDSSVPVEPSRPPELPTFGETVDSQPLDAANASQAASARRE